ncbi:hypothetical protein ACT3S8_06780 [Halomonas sp. AOP42-D2-25]|uniref:hypothetical protein n=1 Tax=Halomonas sp. AOP42-D2-25 TaxID=3457666 RepID=UPI004033CB04
MKINGNQQCLKMAGDEKERRVALIAYKWRPWQTPYKGFKLLINININCYIFLSHTLSHTFYGSVGSRCASPQVLRFVALTVAFLLAILWGGEFVRLPMALAPEYFPLQVCDQGTAF